MRAAAPFARKMGNRGNTMTQTLKDIYARKSVRACENRETGAENRTKENQTKENQTKESRIKENPQAA